MFVVTADEDGTAGGQVDVASVVNRDAEAGWQVFIELPAGREGRDCQLFLLARSLDVQQYQGSRSAMIYRC